MLYPSATIKSLRNHHDHLKVLIETMESKPALVALCETWLSDNDTKDLYQLDGYLNLVVSNRSTQGVLVVL